MCFSAFTKSAFIVRKPGRLMPVGPVGTVGTAPASAAGAQRRVRRPLLSLKPLGAVAQRCSVRCRLAAANSPWWEQRACVADPRGVRGEALPRSKGSCRTERTTLRATGLPHRWRRHVKRLGVAVPHLDC